MRLKELKEAVVAVAGNLFDIPVDALAFSVDYTTDDKFGDFATNFALVYAKELKMNPRELAQRLGDTLIRDESRIEKVDVAGPGFINITLKQDAWINAVKHVSDTYGQTKSGNGTKVQVEYISANPTGPLTIGNARGGFIGDVLSNVLAWSGYAVTREYYFNDAGTQVDKLLISIKMQAGIIPESDERQYRGTYVADLAHHFKEDLQTLSDDELKRKVTKYIIEHYIKPSTRLMGIAFDVWFNEYDLIVDGSFTATLARLDKLGLVFTRDGATWLKTGDLGDDRKERVIIKSTGVPTYMAPDIAYHVNIFGERNFDYAIKVLGPDHIAQFPSVYAAVHSLFPHKVMRMASYQWLRIIKDGKEVKVSKRLGQFITIDDLITSVGMPVARFLTLMRSADSHMDFDLDLASEESAKNPYYYVMYSYARANSILQKAKDMGIRLHSEVSELTPRELKLVRQISKFPELIELIADDYGVHRLTFYGLELAKLFTELYEETRIIDMPKEVAGRHLYVIDKYVAFMKAYWNLLGIEPQSRMD